MTCVITDPRSPSHRAVLSPEREPDLGGSSSVWSSTLRLRRRACLSALFPAKLKSRDIRRKRDRSSTAVNVSLHCSPFGLATSDAIRQTMSLGSGNGCVDDLLRRLVCHSERTADDTYLDKVACTLPVTVSARSLSLVERLALALGREPLRTSSQHCQSMTMLTVDEDRLLFVRWRLIELMMWREDVKPRDRV